MRTCFRSFISEFNLSDYQLLQIKRLLFTGSIRPLTQEEVNVVREVAARKMVYLKGTYVRKLRRSISSWKVLAEEFLKDYAALQGSYVNDSLISFPNINRFAAQDLGRRKALLLLNSLSLGNLHGNS